MTTQPEALRLANSTHLAYRVGWQREAAAELRRLHAEHEEDQGVIAVWRGRTLRAEAQRDALLEALKICVCAMQDYQAGIGITEMFDKGERLGRAAIKAVEEGK